MAALSWLWSIFSKVIVEKLIGFLFAFWRELKERETDHVKNKNQAAQDTEKLKNVNDKSTGEEVDDAIDDSLNHF